ncbi:uncharacterized protein LOC112094919, partial [Morus notabilis]|uniref:uncharacterized protein LOC112094919 n=1 Tax=Morus notabilis TaxID=981085 RepID=UPI000CECF849
LSDIAILPWLYVQDYAHFCRGKLYAKALIYSFVGRPFVEYKGTVPQTELQKELELDINKLISRGGKVCAAVLPYEEAAEMCGGCLPDYIPKGSTPRILRLGDYPGCPCGGTHVSDISDIISVT